MTTPVPARVLVVEDDRTMSDLVALYLRHAGYLVSVEHTGDGAMTRLGTESFDLMVLDVMLPGVSGLDICRAVRAQGDTPIILLTARTGENDRVMGLDLGADDYVTKPFSPRELVARVGAVLRRAPPGAGDVFRRDDLEVDHAAHTVRRSGQSVALTPTEFGLLAALVRRPGAVLSRRQLLEALPGERMDTLDRAVDVHVRNLRLKVEVDPARPRWVLTVPGAGYRFASKDE